MKKNSLFATTFVSAVLTGCATQAINDSMYYQAVDLNSKVESGALTQKAETLYIISDASSSMSKVYEGGGFTDLNGATKLSVSNAILNRINQTIPSVSLTTGLRSFGFGECLDWKYTKLNAPLASYSTAGFSEALQTLGCSSGGSPIASAFAAAPDDLSGASGNISVVLLSDGSNYDASPVPAVQALKEQYGDSLCLYAVWVGNESDKQGQAVLNQLTNIGQCGFTTTASSLATASGVSSFVENVLFNEGTPVVTEYDTDGDGVPDSRDQCPDTPKGAKVNALGCWVFHDVLFDIDSSTVKQQYQPMISNAIEVLELNPGLTVEIQGHTDSTGTDAYNQGLSERRAKSVKEALLQNGIDPSRLTTVGYGESRPVASNATASGRALNRRVEYKRTDR